MQREDDPTLSLAMGQMKLRALSDEELMDECVRDSDEAFRELVDRFKARVINLVARFISDRDRAEEISQEVFLAAYL